MTRSSEIHRRELLRAMLGGVCGAGLTLGAGCRAARGDDRIHVGVLHSQTGTLAMSERAVTDATLMGLEELNARGGVAGRRIEIHRADGGSDGERFAREAERLIRDHGVVVIFGCWTSWSRKLVKQVVERHDNLLLYPLQYEGIESSGNIVYLGEAPNQQLAPAAAWSFDTLGTRCFHVGSDYVYPRVAGAMLRDYWTALGGEMVGDMYLPLGKTELDEVVDAIARAEPDVVFNTINGDSNVLFFRLMRRAGFSPDTLPIMSFSIAEDELRALDAGMVAGNYATWSYFQSLDSDDNRRFIERFQRRFGAARVLSAPMEAAYVGTQLWGQAVERAGTASSHAVSHAILGQSLAAPEGMVYVDTGNRHLWKSVRIGRARSDGQFDILWDSGKPVRPEPYPITRPRSAWSAYLVELYEGWNEEWVKPPT